MLTVAILSDKGRSAFDVGRGGKAGGVSASSTDSSGSTQASDSTSSSPPGMSVCCILSLIELASDWSFALLSWDAFPERCATLASRTYYTNVLIRQPLARWKIEGEFHSRQRTAVRTSLSPRRHTAPAAAPRRAPPLLPSRPQPHLLFLQAHTAQFRACQA